MMKKDTVLEQVLLEVKEHYPEASIEVCKVEDVLLDEMLSYAKSKPFMEEMVFWYDDEEDLLYNTWVDIEGEGYGWLWLTVDDNQEAWHEALFKRVESYVKDSKEKRSWDEPVLIIKTETAIIYRFLEREYELRDTVWTFSDVEMNYL